MATAVCRDVEGWKVISQLRSFDFTLCFQEGIIISTLLTALFLSAACRSWILCIAPSQVRSAKSWRLLTAKLVRCVRFLIDMVPYLLSFNDRHCSQFRSLAVLLVLSSYFTPRGLCLSCRPLSLNRYLLWLPSHLPISTIPGLELPRRFFYSFGLPT